MRDVIIVCIKRGTFSALAGIILLSWTVWCSCEYVYVWKLSCTYPWD